MSTTIITAMVFPSIAIATVTVLATDSGMQQYVRIKLGLLSPIASRNRRFS